MVIGTSGPLPTAPSKPVTFLEDMDDSELALAVSSLEFDSVLPASLNLSLTLPPLPPSPHLRLSRQPVSSTSETHATPMPRFRLFAPSRSFETRSHPTREAKLRSEETEEWVTLD